KQSNYDEHTLYVGEKMSLHQPAPDKGSTSCILLTAYNSASDQGKHSQANVLHTSKAEDLSALFNRILEIMDYFQTSLRHLEQMKHKNNGLQAMVQLYSSIMGNPAYITDASFKVLAADRSPLFSEISAIWKHTVGYGYLPYDIVYNLRKSGELEQLEKGESPILFHSNFFNNPFIAHCLKHEEQVYGYMFIVGYEKRCTPGDVALAKNLGDLALDVLLSTVVPIGLLGNDYEHFFIHVLDGGFHDNAQITSQLSPLSWKIDDTYCVIRIESELPDDTLYLHICKQLEQLDQVMPLMYRGAVTAVCAIDGTHSMKDLLQRMRSLVPKIKCCCGVSDRFRGFQNLRFHHLQAEEALKDHHLNAGSNKTPYSVITYTDCAIECMLRNSDSGVLDLIRWETLDNLIEYDREHDSDYIRTLEYYLRYERNISMTCKALFIHRNTLLYRIERLSQLLSCDLDDPSVRLRLSLCLKMMHSAEKT
ncbi:MAG: helix-turn-helix domain-containing protein, partial [Lachnospiraceae bacterium]|nr:helix-turn-helix domain-containing protein [Lachnospiraceae bacterium]